MRCMTLLAANAALLTFLSPTAVADTQQDGFAIDELPYPGLLATTTLDNGDIIAFDGTNLSRHDEDGTLIATIVTLPDFVYPSFLLADPAEEFVLLGESSNGDLINIDLTFPSPLTIGNVPFNYAAVFLDAHHVLVSAASQGFGNGTQIYRVETGSGHLEQIAQVAGASGPVAVDAGGNVFYGLASDQFPSPPGSSSILMWTAAQANSGDVLTEADAVVVEAGLSGAAALAYDPFRDRMYLAENDFGTGVNRIRIVNGGANAVLLDGTPGNTISTFEFRGGDGLAELRPYQPEAASLLYNTTDFFSVFARRSLHARRPVATCTGPGTFGAGVFDIGFHDAPPGGYAVVYYNLRSTMPGTELVLPFRFPFFFGLSLTQLGRVTGSIAADASGVGSASFVNPGGLEGLFGIQLVFFDAANKLAGTSNVTFL